MMETQKKKGRKPEQVSGLPCIKYTDFEISHKECVLVTPVTAVWVGGKGKKEKDYKEPRIHCLAKHGAI